MSQIHEDQINKKYIIFEGFTSEYIFMLPIFILACSIFYVVNSNQDNQNYIVFIISIPFFINSFLSYLRKKIILTKSSIYYFVNKNSSFSVKLASEFNIFDIKQTSIEKFLNYGTVYIFNKNGEFIEYKFFKDPLNFRKKLVKVYIEEMKKIDPSFELEGETYSEDETSNIDRVD